MEKPAFTKALYSLDESTFKQLMDAAEKNIADAKKSAT